MSIARVYTQTARKDQGKCEKCGTPLPPGTQYRHFTVGFRSHWKRRRCMKATCTPRPSELESSLLSEVYAAQESAEDTLSSLEGNPDDDTTAITDAVQEVMDAVESVADQYEQQDEAFGGTQSTEAYERAEILRSSYDTLDSLQLDEDPEDWCDAHNIVAADLPTNDGKGTIETEGELDEARQQCDDCKALRVEWWDEQVQAARDAITEVELP